MLAYIIRRLLLIIPTLLGIMVINFAVVQVAPGGPVERILAEIQGQGMDATARISGTESADVMSTDTGSSGDSKYRGSQGIPPELIAELEQQFGFDKPAHERFLHMMGNFITFDFGTSFYRDQEVIDLVLEKMPVLPYGPPCWCNPPGDR